MRASIKQLLTPLNYLRIKVANKIWFDLYLPLISAILVMLVVITLPGHVNVLKAGGLVEGIAGLLPMLAGFYIAALAAVATFSRESIDTPLSGASATLNVEVKGVRGSVNLTRRQFICYLFGYLSFLCIFYIYTQSRQ